MNNQPIGILLAAGQSRRFGSDKLLQPLADGTPLVIASAQKLSRVLSDCLAVVNPATPALLIQQLAQLGYQIVVNELAETGMGSSIASGVSASAQATSWIFALADMPFIHPDTIKKISDTLLDGAGIAAPVYEQQRGHPVGFAARYRDELLSLNDDIGARYIIAEHFKDLVTVEVEDRGVIWDIDAVTDLPATNSQSISL